MHQYTSNISWKFVNYISVYTDGSCATVFPSDTELSMRLPDSASIFSAEIWAIITALEEIKNASASTFIFLQTHFRVSKVGYI